jgi:hypothetical protein
MTKIIKDEKQLLFDEYLETAEEFEEIKRQTARVLERRSSIVERIFKYHGVGPFRYKGVVYSVSKRINKLTMKDTYFFITPSYLGIEEIQ